jgi:hypothetical protein
MGTIAASPRELLRIRRDNERTGDRSIEIWRIVAGADGRPGTEDGKGGRILTYARHSAGSGRITPLSNREGTYAEATYADKLGGRQPFMATLGHDRNLRMSDQLRFGGRTFEVVTIDEPRSFSAQRRIVVAEIT